jgi:transcriptional regulator with XRE-family HTH domain
MRNRDTIKRLGEVIRTQRELLGMTQRELADALGLYEATAVSDYEYGIRVPHLDRLITLASALDLTMTDLWELVEDPDGQRMTELERLRDQVAKLERWMDGLCARGVGEVER